MKKNDEAFFFEELGSELTGYQQMAMKYILK